MDVSVLGAIEVRHDGRLLDLGTPKQRALVAGLALAHGWPVSVDAIIDLLWGDDAPPGVTGTLQTYVSQLRRVLEPDRAPRTPATVLVTAAPGYALRVADERVDAHRFEQVVARAHRHLQPLADWGPHELDAGLLDRERGELDAVIALWRGTPYSELGEAPGVVAERVRLEEFRLVAVEDRAVAALALGDHAPVAAELEALTSAHPLRERLWTLRAIALARSGRQAAALDVVRELREVLDEELGIEPSAAVRDLQTALLRQDEALAWVAPAASVPAAPTDEQPTAPAPAPAPHRPAEEQVAPWPMVGRDAELAALVGLVGAAGTGVPSFAALTGEPGIGKSRLAAELMLQARRRGVKVVIGRCSQDEGAPPLWPWKGVLEGLGADLLTAMGSPAEEDEGGQFRSWERICDGVRAAAREQTVAVLLEDLHWADPSTLRVLRLLVESVADERMLVIGTWRAQPEPTGALADVAEALARRHAHRVALGGLPERDVRTVFQAVAHRDPAADETAALAHRTDGNPFFLVELARLAAERGSEVDLASGRLPAAVGEVIDRRLARLPETTVATLRVASVIGRRFDLPTLAVAAGIDEDDALDVIEPAQAAGLVRDHGVDHYLFGHALVRDRLREKQSASRLARTHAKVAAALAGAPGRESEEARHWRSAGPAHAARAWRAAVVAAGLARRLHDHDQAAELLRDAVTVQADDPAVTDEERYAVLLDLIEACRWAARLPDLVVAAEDAIAVGKRLRDPEAVARAAISASVGVLWRSAPPGEVNDTVISALRGSLDRLPPGDSDLRCRVLLALANEVSISVPLADRRDIVDEGLAMAVRIDDPALLLDALQMAFAALWVPATAPERLIWVTQAVDLARATGSERRFVVAATLRAVVLSELGRPDEMRQAADVARREAERLRISFGELVLDGLAVPWLAMAGRFEECERLLERISVVEARVAHGDAGEAVAASLLAVRLWQGRALEMVPLLEGFDSSVYPFSASVAMYLARAGELDRARAYVEQRGVALDHETDMSLLAWCHAGELALHLGEPALGADSYARMTPYAGRCCSAGSALASGPVDAYLALAAVAAGETDRARTHADDALAIARDWDLPLFEAWFKEQRDRYGF